MNAATESEIRQWVEVIDGGTERFPSLWVEELLREIEALRAKVIWLTDHNEKMVDMAIRHRREHLHYIKIVDQLPLGSDGLPYIPEGAIKGGSR